MIDKLRSLSKKILRAAGRTPLQIHLRFKKGALVRFTNNGVHQNNFHELCSYTLRMNTDRGPVYAESNDISEEGITQAFEKLKKENAAPQPLAPPGKGKYLKVNEYFPFPVERSPQMAREAIEEALQLIRPQKASANGYFSAYERFFYFADSEGRELVHPATAVRFGVTANKGSGKGYHSFYHPDFKKLKVKPVVRQALGIAEKASRDEIRVKPGIYPCLFSPRAFLELIEPLRRHFDGRLAADGKSVLSGAHGKRIFSPHFSLDDDIQCSGQFGIPFDAEGAPKKPLKLIERGVLKNFLAEGHSTRGVSEHPFYPQNLVAKAGQLKFKELLKKIHHGIFINKIWYHTLVRESTMEVTGLAAAGSLWVEKGRALGHVSHLRYHDSLFSLLRSVEAASSEQILLKDGEMGAALLPYLMVGRLKVV